MASPFCSLLLVTSLVALPASAATQQTTSSPAAQGQVAPTGSAGKTGAATAPKAKRAKTPPAGKTTTAKVPAKSKDAKKAPCDTPETKVAEVKPPPVPADPFAPVVAPCTDPKP